MTDLQWSLLALGAIVVAGVMVFNWQQEWRFRRRAAAAFELQKPAEDALMKVVAAANATTAEPARAVERPPTPATAQAAKAEDWVVTLSRHGVTPPTKSRRAAGDDTSTMVIDYEAVFESASVFSQAAIDDLVRAAATSTRPTRVEGFEGDAARWLPVAGGGGRHRRIRVAMQLADREACATRADLEQFGTRMEACASRIGAELVLPEPHLFEVRAKALDDLCGEVDIAVGISVVAQTGQLFQGTTVRALAEAAGMRLRPEGRFHAEVPGGGDQFTLENFDEDSFSPDGMRLLTTTGVTFVLDVPRAQGGIAAYDRMVQLARQFAQSLDGTLVDDNRQKLNDSGLDATRRALAAVHATMQAQGIEPGSALALRLFA